MPFAVSANSIKSKKHRYSQTLYWHKQLAIKISSTPAAFVEEPLKRKRSLNESVCRHMQVAKHSRLQQFKHLKNSQNLPFLNHVKSSPSQSNTSSILPTSINASASPPFKSG